MKQFIVFVQKEFLHVFRDRKSLLMLFGLPIVQIILFGFALTNEFNNAKLLVIDYSRDIVTTKITAQINASNYFDVETDIINPDKLEPIFASGKYKAVVIFPRSFQKDLLHLNKAQIQIIADGSDPNTATTMISYLSAIIGNYQQELLGQNKMPYRINTNIRMLYNPLLKAAYNFVPGVMALILMLVCVMMTSISIVKEKELGSMEILLVSPFKPILVILSKAIPYLLISILNVVIILLLSVTLMDMPINGSIVLLFLESILFITTCLSIGLLISTATDSQQVAMLLSMMGMMLPTLLLTGFMFPLENLPAPMRFISNIIPSRWYFFIAKSIMIKGLGIASLWKETLILLTINIVVLVISFRKFKIRLE